MYIDHFLCNKSQLVLSSYQLKQEPVVLKQLKISFKFFQYKFYEMFLNGLFYEFRLALESQI